jgi:alcohol dehydrogenase
MRALEAFDFRSPTRLVFGRGAIERLGELAAELGGRRVLVVSDPGVAAAGHTGRGIESLRAAGLDVFLFDGVEENPTTRHVAAGVAAAREVKAELLVGLGGGSSMDCAKGINFIYSCGGEMKDYWGIDKAPKPLLPMVAVPTTAGTGSETQSFALIADEATHQKMACGDRKAAFLAALLDPEVTVSQPPLVTAATGLDAIAHAVESFVCRRRTLLSRHFSMGAWRLLEGAFERVLADPSDLEARAAMQVGAALAGSAIECSMLGAAHAAANPLTAHHGLVHGNAVGMMLPEVVRFNGAGAAGDDYHELARLAGGGVDAASPAALARRLEHLLERSGLRPRLRDWGVERHRLPELAREAARQWTAQFNPRPVGEGEFLAMYEAVY